MHDIQFGTFRTERGPAKVNPPLREVFSGDVTEHAHWFAPLLSFELRDVSSAWGGRVHFIYHEVGSVDCFRYRLDGGRYVFLGDFSDCNEDVPIDEPPEFYVPPFMDFVSVRVPSSKEPFAVRPEIREQANRIWDGDPKWKHAEEEFLYWAAVDDAATAIDASLTSHLHFGGAPKWLQSDATPKDASGQPMAFVGQVESTHFSKQMAKVAYYMFLAPEERVVAIVNQVG